MSRPVADALQALQKHHAANISRSMRALFAADAERFQKFSARLDDLLLDYSKTAVTGETMKMLADLAETADIAGKREAMFSGAVINTTEKRAVLHTALRNRGGRPVMVGGQDVMPDVARVLAAFTAFAEDVRSGAVAAHDGKPFSDVVNIGIGGSDLGPAMATLALAPDHDGPRLHFVSNVDPAHIADTLKGLDPARTLFIVASKTFGTQETMANARTARAWLAEALGEAAVAAHFAAVSTALDKVAAFGIAPDRVFGFWDWVGGRYSIWSAIGLPLAIAIGAERFGRFLDGAYAMDEHFRTAPTLENLPVLLGLLAIWHRNGCGYPARAVIPYDQRLARLPAYLQQLSMESNGKRVMADGQPVDSVTGMLVWGEPGTNGQHAFFQLIHQGTDVIPVEFIVARESRNAALAGQHAMLLANCLAQSRALMLGRTREEAKAQLLARGIEEAEAERLSPHRVFPGDRPSITLLHQRLDPYTLGRLIALYEHATFVEAAVWGINAYDQWGVELGKELADTLLPILEGKSPPPPDLDGSTRALLADLRG